MDACSGDRKGWSSHLRLIRRRQVPHLCYKSLDSCPPFAVNDVNSQNKVRVLGQTFSHCDKNMRGSTK